MTKEVGEKMPTIQLSEEQVLDMARRLSASERRKLLRILIPDMDRFEGFVDYGEQRAREVSAQRGLDWDRLTPEERERLVDEILHEP